MVLFPIIAASALLLAARERTRRRQAERFGAALLESLLNAIDANDADTGRHVRRVAHVALAIADAAGLDETQRREVEWVALFHDIGKIHEALFDIVHEATELSSAERRAVGTHPRRGARVLAPLCPFSPGLSAGVVAHHERWDGNGYPRRLGGSDIPLSARIVAIADTFDAVTHNRRYQQAKTRDQALRIIQEGSGRHFDPALVRLFLSDHVQSRLAHTDEPVKQQQADDRRGRAVHGNAPNVSFRWRDGGEASQEPGPGL